MFFLTHDSVACTIDTIARHENYAEGDHAIHRCPEHVRAISWGGHRESVFEITFLAYSNLATRHPAPSLFAAWTVAKHNPSDWQLEQRRMQPRWYYRRDSRGLGIDIGYGLGWVIASDGTYAHAGSWETFAWVDPNREIVGLILTQNVGGRNPGIEFINVVNAAVLDASNPDSP